MPACNTTSLLLALLTFVPLGIARPAQGRADEAVASAIDAVTVYRDQAQVIRRFDVPASPELQRIRVTGLPAQLVEGTAYAESEANTTVRSVRVYTTTQVSPESQQKLRQLRAELGELEDELEAAEQMLAVIEQDLLTVEKLVRFSAEKAQQNLDRATLDSKTVTELADFTMQRRRLLAAELHEAQGQVQQLQEDIVENQSRQQKISAQQQTRAFEAMVEVNSPEGGWVRLAYRVNQVSWTPRYTLRGQSGDDDSRTFELQLAAVVSQASGEDWQDVALTLSTAQPDIQSAGPMLTPLRVGTAATAGGTAAVSPSPAETLAGLSGRDGQEVPGWQDQAVWQRDIGLNAEAGRRQLDELSRDLNAQREVAADAGADITDATYRVPGRIDLDSRAGGQTVAISNDTLNGELAYVVTPLLSSFAYRQAELTNTLGRNLIAGEAGIYLDDKFVGTTTLPPTAAGGRLLVGFGADRQLRTRRELLSRDSSIHGGNQRQELKVRLVVSNYHDHPVSVRLLDRVPVSNQDAAISVALSAEADDQLSDDGLYRRMQYPTGILRWDLDVPAERFGSKAFDFEYRFTLEYDRQQQIVGDQMIESIRNDYRFENSSGGGMGGMGGGIF
ncbi:DUF4139 domain-containing protein [Roseimaritima ulvae]|uniref:DUF4139 domain-containing protein n=1 Tax=Roseimaritima ulvae TaxID=980254 RepID=A0A5B9QLS5_9BACT|nr:DUF4139 domain-containing protein [Roseimaritima ulvae]QEG38762.1 hypothetical protein UC8_07200 [Roseimaritima ulvae]